jgi:hypothetical protein
MHGQAIVRIARIVSDKPESGTYFEVKNGWNTETQTYTVISLEGRNLSYNTSYCNDTTFKE